MKNTCKDILTATALFTGMFVSFSSTALAYNVHWKSSTADSDFDNSANWQHRPGGGEANFDGVPDENTTIVIADYHVPANQPALTSSTSYTVDGLYVGFGATAEGALDISDGSLSPTGFFSIGIYNDATGTINVNGGTLNLPTGRLHVGNSTGTGTLNLSSGTISGVTNTALWIAHDGGGSGVFNISGGTMNDNNVQIHMRQGGNATLSVTGSTADLSMNNLYVKGDGINTLNFTADANGISTLNTNYAELDGNDITINVDITNYQVSNGTTLNLLHSQWGDQATAATNFDYFTLSITGGSGTIALINDEDGFGYTIALTDIDKTINYDTSVDVGIKTAVKIEFTGEVGKFYKIEHSLDLNTWNTVEEEISGAGATIERFYATEDYSTRFFQVSSN